MKKLLVVFMLLIFCFVVGCNIKRDENSKYTIKYDLNGGLCEDLDYEFFLGEVVELPIPVKEGYSFIGWYELDENGNKVLIDSIENRNYNLIAGWEENEVFELVIESLPNKLDYYIDEDLSFEGLKLSLISQNDKYDVIDYDVLYNELVTGENEITIKYKNYTQVFKINIREREKEDLNEHTNYLDKTFHVIDYTRYSNKIDNIIYSNKRDKDQIICYDEENFVETNIYGYEILLDEYGKIIDKNVKVEIKEKCTVISAHGNRVNDIKNLNIGDYGILINNTLYIYDECNVYLGNNVFIKFYEIKRNLKLVTNVLEYNEIIYKLNNLIPSLELLYNEYNEDNYEMIYSELLNIENNLLNIYDHNHQYSYIDVSYDNYVVNEASNPVYVLHTIYNDLIHYGGFRNKDSIHYYDKDCYRERNRYGYEIAVNKDGIVVDKDIIVDLPEDGFILSGHTLGADFLINNVALYDKIVIDDNTFKVYRDNIYMIYNTMFEDVNELINVINLEKENSIPHDYKYIDEIINVIDKTLCNNQINDNSLYKMYILKNNYDYVNKLISLGYSQLVNNNINNTSGMWYYPFRNTVYDDTSLEGVKKTIQILKKLGINEVIINPFYGSYSLFENSIYELSEVLNGCSYGEYGNDYLKCFITEAHNEGILVNCFTQTFANASVSFIDKSDGYYQIDYQGEKSLGSINYYDICNDNLQNILLIWYKELVEKYDFDKIEYDIIRYPSSNLYKYLNVERINDDVVIIDHGYTEYSMNKFMNKFGYSGDLRQLIRTSKEVRTNWLIFKEEELIKFITNCTMLIKEINPDIIITAAVLNDYENASRSYLQDCKKWLELGIIDEVEVMVYTESESKVVEKIDYYSKLLSDYNVRIGLSARLSVRDLRIDLKQFVITSNYNGYILFANNLYYDNEFILLMSLSHHYDTYDCNNEELLYTELIDKVKNFYEVKNNESYDDLIKALQEFDLEKVNDEISKIEDKKMAAYLKKCLK